MSPLRITSFLVLLAIGTFIGCSSKNSPTNPGGGGNPPANTNTFTPTGSATTTFTPTGTFFSPTFTNTFSATPTPPCQTPGSFGKLTRGTYTTTNCGDSLATRYAVPKNGYITGLTICIVSGGTGNFCLGVYSDANGLPGNLLVKSVPITNPSAGWVTVPVSNTLVYAGYCWLALQGDANCNINFSYDNNSSSSVDFNAASFPVSYNSSTANTTSTSYPLYANYCSAAPGSIPSATFTFTTSLTLTPTISSTQTITFTPTVTNSFTPVPMPSGTVTPVVPDITGNINGAPVTGDTTSNPNSYSNNGFGANSPDAAFKFTINSTQSVTISTCGSAFDTVLYLRSILSSSTSTILFNDDSNFCGLGSKQSMVSGVLAAGTYYVIVDGYGAATDKGLYQLTITSSSAPTVTPTFTVPPCVSQSNFGLTTAQSTEWGPCSSSYVEATVFTLPKDAFVNSLSIHMDNAYPSDQMKMALYADAGGVPGTLLTQSVPFNLTSSGWNTVSVPAAFCYAGQYWIAEKATNNSCDYYDYSNGQSGWMIVQAYDSYSSPFAGTFGALTNSWANYAFEAYASYCTAAPGSYPSATSTGTPTYTATFMFTTTPTITPTFTISPTLTTAPTSACTFTPKADISANLVSGASVTGDTTSNPNHFNNNGYGSSSPDEFYSFTLTQAASVTLSTCGSSFDTVLYLRTVCSDSNTTIVLNDDSNACGVGSKQSQITAGLAAGTYYVIIDGYGAATDKGPYRLNINSSLANTPTPTYTVPPCTSMSNFGNTSPQYSSGWATSNGNPEAFLVTLPKNGFIESLSVEMSQAYPSDQMRLALYADAGGLPGNLVTQSALFNLTSSGWITVPVQEAFCYAGNCWIAIKSTGGSDNFGYSYNGGGVTTVVETSDSSTTPFSSAFGAINSSWNGYYFAAYASYCSANPGTYPSATFTGTPTNTPTFSFTSTPTITTTFTITPTLTVAPTSACTFSPKADISTNLVNGTSVSGNTSTSTNKFSNNGYGGNAPDDLYVFTLTQAGQVTFSTCGSSFDTVLYLRAVCNDPNTTIILNDDSVVCGAGSKQSSITAGLAAGTYYLIVDGYNAATDAGPYTLSMSLAVGGIPPTATNTPTPYCNAPSKYGVTTAPYNWGGDSNSWASKVNVAKDEYVQSLAFYLNGPGNPIQFAVYADDGTGNPGSLITQSAILSSPVSGWNTVPVPQALLYKGYYWLAFASQGSSNNLYYGPIGYSTDSKRASSNFSGSFPPTFGPTNYDWSTSYAFCIYANTCPAAPGTYPTATLTGTATPTPSFTPTFTPIVTSTPTAFNTPTVAPTPFCTFTPIADITANINGAAVVGNTSAMANNFSDNGYGTNSPDALYVFTLASTQTVTIDTCGSSFDTVLYVRPVCGDQTTDIMFNDDSTACGASSVQSQVSGLLAAGTYYVIIDGYSAATDSGAYTLHITAH